MKQIYFSFFLMLAFISNISSQPGFEPDTIFVSPGWNLIGSKFSGAVSDMVTTEPPGILASPFYKYNVGGGYLAADTLEESSGYWVKIGSPQNGPGLTFIVIYPVLTGFDCGHPISGRVWYNYKLYYTAQIGSQCWFKENLNVGTRVDGSVNQINNGVTEKYCWGDDISNCTTYGGLYQWGEAMKYSTTPGAQGICPNGWHIPTYQEFLILKTTVAEDGNALKSVGQGSGAGAGTNESGFSALLAGDRIPDFGGIFAQLTLAGYFWSSSEVTSEVSYDMGLFSLYDIISLSLTGKTLGQSVRCLKNN